jgi:hypothetical protein
LHVCASDGRLCTTTDDCPIGGFDSCDLVGRLGATCL